MRGLSILICLLALVGRAQGSPSVTGVSPRALVPGKTTVLNFTGTGLASVSNLWASFGGSARRLPQTNNDQVSFEVNCPPEINGVQVLQLAGARGASDFQLILADRLPTQTTREGEPKRDALHLPHLSSPVAIEGMVHPEQSDSYRLSAKAGDTFSIEAIGHRIGSEMDPVVRVLNPRAREVGFCDDAPGVWRDPRFTFTAPETGEFTILVEDAAFAGGPNYFYRLRVTHDPLVWYSFPVLSPYESSSAEAIGTASAPPGYLSPADPPQGVFLSAEPSVAEAEPNDSVERAQRLFVPTIVNGMIGAATDVDVYRLEAENDQKLLVQSATRSLGSPCDLVLTLRSAEGKVMGGSDPNLPGEAALTNRFVTKGSYFLEVRELSGNSRVPYRLSLRLSEPGVTADASENRLEAPPGGTVTIPVNLRRYDYEGPVVAEMEPAREDITVQEIRPGEKKEPVAITLKLSTNAVPGHCAHFRMKIGPKEMPLRTPVSTSSALRKSFPLILNAPAVANGWFSLTTVATQ